MPAADSLMMRAALRPAARRLPARSPVVGVESMTCTILYRCLQAIRLYQYRGAFELTISELRR
jgi:hypothetical protein